MKTFWVRARKLAASTPPYRDRYIDLLRAVSILTVVLGHWLAAAPYVDAEHRLVPLNILAISRWSHWLTWGLQVMPVFFMVGGFANGASWQSAIRAGSSYAAWLDGRLRRLVLPFVPLLVGWIAILGGEYLAGVTPELMDLASKVALIPAWFLVVYLGMVVSVPVTHALWRRFGIRSFWALAIAAAVTDFAFFRFSRWLGWANYALVWAAVHQLGYAWKDGWFCSPRKTLVLAPLGLSAMLLLTSLGPYPVAMVGVPGSPVSNTSPPKVILIALAALQIGVLLPLQGPVRRWLARGGPWMATVLVNGMIMTTYLWHMTATVLVVLISYALGGMLLTLAPGSTAWWWSRPLWIAVNGTALALLVALFARFERPPCAFA